MDKHHPSNRDDNLNAPAAPLRCQAFLLNPDGAVLRVAKLPACSDEDALNRAKALVDGYAVELWDGVRFILHLPPEKPPSK